MGPWFYLIIMGILTILMIHALVRLVKGWRHMGRNLKDLEQRAALDLKASHDRRYGQMDKEPHILTPRLADGRLNEDAREYFLNYPEARIRQRELRDAGIHSLVTHRDGEDRLDLRFVCEKITGFSLEVLD